MHFSTALVGIVAAASIAVAGPTLKARANAVSAMAEAPEWIIQSFTRTCNKDNTSCLVSFGVNTQIAPPTNCSYTVTGSPASQAPTNGITCGPYTVSSSWSDQFGPKNGFTTWAVVDHKRRVIVWPAYSDRELVNGQAVTPDKSYAPQALP
ncbi:hypothetical protein C7999DRAFT_41206 [Corynascus novoguineensis]|uniref:Small secreted protein n=1 Tax=Corynascus novoguineensis TaxID=1126955 RepID=A0AAN7CSB9_9PEZI|nr:hypothetical protein C7999DRAFT_41206 [Corynascus novoguineensis]